MLNHCRKIHMIVEKGGGTGPSQFVLWAHLEISWANELQSLGICLKSQLSLQCYRAMLELALSQFIGGGCHSNWLVFDLPQDPSFWVCCCVLEHALCCSGSCGSLSWMRAFQDFQRDGSGNENSAWMLLSGKKLEFLLQISKNHSQRDKWDMGEWSLICHLDSTNLIQELTTKINVTLGVAIRPVPIKIHPWWDGSESKKY